MSGVDWSQFTPVDDTPATPATVDWSQFQPLAPGDSGAVMKAPDPTIAQEAVSTVASGVQKGADYIKRTIGEALPGEPVPDNVAQGLGNTDAADYQRQQAADRFARANQKADAMQQTSQATMRGQQAMSEADKKGWVAAAKAIIENPRAASMTTLQSLGMSAPGLAATSVAGPLMPMVVGLNSGITDYQSTLEDQLNQRGVDLTDPAAVRRAMDDPTIMRQTKAFANAHAIPVTLMDTLTAGLAGRLIARATGKLGVIGAVGAETAAQVAGGAVGEAGGELNSEGKVSSPSNVLMEAVGEAPSEIVEAPVGYREAMAENARAAAALGDNPDHIDLQPVRNGSALQPEGPLQHPQGRTGIDIPALHKDYLDLASTYGGKVTSLDRTPEHNAKVGGVPNSQHVRHTAMDVVVPLAQQSEFIADAHRRGYQTINEGDHIHVQLPHGTRVTPTVGAPTQTALEQQVAEREIERRRQVADQQISEGQATVDDFLDRERAQRGLTPETPPTPPATTPTPITAPEPTKVAAPPAQLPGMNVDQLLEQHKSAIADSNDKAMTPEERRAAKKRAQYLMSEIEAQNAKPNKMPQTFDANTTAMLDQLAPIPPMPQPQPMDATMPPAAAPTTQPTQPLGPADNTLPRVTDATPPNMPPAQQVLDQMPGTATPAETAPVEPQAPLDMPPPTQVAQPFEAPPAPTGAPVEAPPPQNLQPLGEDHPDEMVGQANELGGDMPPEPPQAPLLPQPQVQIQPQVESKAITQNSEHVRAVLNASPHMLLAVNEGRPLAQHQVNELHLPANQQGMIDRLGKVLGRKIILYDVIAPGGKQVSGFAYDNTHIFVNPRSARQRGVSTVSVIGHEFLHTMRADGDPLVHALIDYARSQVNTNSNYAREMIQNYATWYGPRFKNDPAGLQRMITEEMVADMVGDMIGDEKFWNELAQRDPSLFRRTIKRFIAFLNQMMHRAKRMGEDDVFRDMAGMKARAQEILAAHIDAVHKEQVAAGTAASVGPVSPSLSPEERQQRDNQQLAHSAFERGNYMDAVRYANDGNTATPSRMPIDTPEKRAFFKDATRSNGLTDSQSAATLLHGTAQDVTQFRPKQGDATFLTHHPEFAGPYSASAQSWVNTHEGPDAIVDGKSMKEVRANSPVGSEDWMLADMLIREGSPEKALVNLDHYAFVPDQNAPEIEHPQSWEVDALEHRLSQIIQNESFKQGEAPVKSGMNTVPVVTNASNPFDFQEPGHVKRLIAALQEKYRTAKEFGQSMENPHAFENWDEVRRVIASPSSNWTVMEDRGAGVPQAIRELGHDSYFVSEMGYKNLAVMDPRKIKSAYGNVGTFGVRAPTEEEAASLGMTLEEAKAAQAAGDIRLSIGSAVTGMQQALQQQFIGPLLAQRGEAFAQMEAWLLDEFRDLKDIQQKIADNVLGGTLPANYDARQNENLRHGAYQDARKRAEARFIAPIARILTKVGANLDEFSDYLWWRHAPERDAYLRSKLDPAIAGGVADDALAGISPAEAQANIAALDPRKRAAFERAAKFIDGMRKFTLQTLVDSGQITQDHYDALLNQYQHYVPLRGIDDENIGDKAMGTGRGLSMTKNPIGPRAAGRKTKPKNIMEEMMSDMDRSLVGVQKQRVLSAIVRLIAAEPHPELWELSPIDSKRVWRNGVLTIEQTNGVPEDQLTFMHRGVPIAIQINHPRLKKALLGMNKSSLPQGLRMIGRATRWLSAVKTSFSPMFLMVNPVRDGALAVMGMGAEHGMAALRDMAKFYPHTYSVLGHDDNYHRVAPSNNPTIAKLQQYAREFASVGGKTGYTYVNDIREQNKKLNKLIELHAKSKGMKDIMAGNFDSKDAALLAKKAWQHVGHTFELVNDMAENSTRLAVYAAMREKGLSVEDSAAYAKEVTVNFNRRGAMAKWVGSAYMFFNASVQGTARVAKLTMNNRKFQATMGGMFAMSYALALGQMFAAGDDDDGEGLYDKAVPDQQAQRTISIMLGGGKSLAIPMPYGPNIFTYLGYRLAKFTYDQAKGKNPSIGDVVGDSMTQAFNAMSPIDPSKGWSALAPEVVRIPLAIGTNRSDFGGPIAPKVDAHDRTDMPNYYKTDVKTGDLYRMMAASINWLTGGGAYQGGAINLAGEQVRYGVQQAGGGMMTLGSQSYELLQNLLAGIDPEPSDIPLANVYYRGKGAKAVDDSYYRNMDYYQKTVAMWKQAVANGDTAGQDAILKTAPWVEGAEEDAGTTEGRLAQQGSVMEQVRSVTHDINDLRKQKTEVLSDPTLTRREKKQQAHAIDLQMYELEKDYNFAINSGRGYPSTQR